MPILVIVNVTQLCLYARMPAALMTLELPVYLFEVFCYKSIKIITMSVMSLNMPQTEQIQWSEAELFIFAIFCLTWFSSFFVFFLF